MIVAFRPVTVAQPMLQCDVCGALVADKTPSRIKHREWHERLAYVASEATRMRPTDRIG